ncbi:hypothetical protein VPHK379_0057 [Vibrio phage K379]
MCLTQAVPWHASTNPIGRRTSLRLIRLFCSVTMVAQTTTAVQYLKTRSS